MSLARQLESAMFSRETLSESWKSVAELGAQGRRYEGVFAGDKAVLEKRKKNFFLIYRGKEYDLGKRATFDHAERKIAQVNRG